MGPFRSRETPPLAEVSQTVCAGFDGYKSLARHFHELFEKYKDKLIKQFLNRRENCDLTQRTPGVV